jgi:hypothetical protein
MSSASLVYVGRLKDVVRGVKMMSVSSCVVTSGAAPLLMMTQAHPSPVVAATAATFALFGLFTTTLVTWVTSPYVQRMTLDEATKLMTVDTLNLIGARRTTSFPLDMVEPKARSKLAQATMRPFVTFGLRDSKRLFFVHTDDVPAAWRDKLV